MPQYLFFLGRKHQLAFAELKSVLNRLHPEGDLRLEFSERTALFRIRQTINPDHLIRILGGTVKIGMYQQSAASANSVLKTVKVLKQSTTGRKKIIFGISQLSGNGPAYSVSEIVKIKEQLGEAGIPARYILPKDGTEISSAQIDMQKIIEIYWIFDSEKKLHGISKTVAIQDYKSFSARDYQRPYADPHSGMLPPKVAKMMINLSLPEKIKTPITLLDPFCGTGTIAMEAMNLNIKSVSSDIKEQKVEGTAANLEWLKQKLGADVEYETLLSDVTHISDKLKKKVDCVVTEPFLGPINPQKEKIKNIIKGLDKLYLGAIKELAKCLKRGGKVVIVLPKIKIGSVEKAATLVIDRCENLGYTLVDGPFTYDRQGAKVKRLIYILKKM